MPWLETAPVEQRERFVDDCRQGIYAVTELCARYGISRKTGYKWLARYDGGGPPGTRATARGRRTAVRIGLPPTSRQLDLRCTPRASDVGPGETSGLARHAASRICWPAISTAGDLLAAGAWSRRGVGAATTRIPGVVAADQAHAQRSVDRGLQGPFPHPRRALLLSPHGRRSAHALSAGLPRAAVHAQRRGAARLRSPVPRLRPARGPFGPTTACRSRRSGFTGSRNSTSGGCGSGIQHQRIHPGQPQQNGAHERMHRTLKGEATRPPRAHGAAQQRAFNPFARVYNDERPHQRSEGRHPRRSITRHGGVHGVLPPLEYPRHFIVKRVTNGGEICFKKRLLFLAKALHQHPIGLEEVADGIWSIYF